MTDKTKSLITVNVLKLPADQTIHKSSTNQPILTQATIKHECEKADLQKLEFLKHLLS